MPYERTGYAPWSLTREAGVQSATVDGTIQVPQYIQPVLDTGFVDEKGNWKGVKSSDETFFIVDPSGSIASGANVLMPNTADKDFIDMTGFVNLFFAVKPTIAGNYTFEAVMGPDTHSYANLNPVNAAATIKGAHGSADFTDACKAVNTVCGANVWNVFSVTERLAGHKLFQIKVINNSGSTSNIDFAYMRIAQ